MLAEYKTKTNIGVGIGLLLEIGGQVLTKVVGGAAAIPGSIIALVGVIVFIWGCMNYAVGKGHSKWLGLLGLFSCIGLIVLILLPDQHKTPK